jgi:hypothetical protein
MATSLQWGGPPCPPPLRESMAGTAARPTIKSDGLIGWAAPR